jgi:hypothetical protein
MCPGCVTYVKATRTRKLGGHFEKQSGSDITGTKTDASPKGQQ